MQLCVLDWLYHPALPAYDEEEVFPLTGPDYHPAGMALLWTCALGLGVSSDTDTVRPNHYTSHDQMPHENETSQGSG